MKAYIQFLEVCDKWDQVHMKWLDESVIKEPCGSDAVFILDGRNNHETWVNDGFEQMARLKAVQPRFVGFQVRRGSRFTSSHELSTHFINQEMRDLYQQQGGLS